MFKNITKETLLVTLFTVLFALFFTAISLYLGAQVAKGQQAVHATRILTEMDKLVGESQTTLTLLDRTPDITCTSSYIQFLKQIMFQAKYAKDIGVIVDNKVVCSISRGIFDSSIALEPADFSLGNNIEMIVSSELELFDFEYAALRVKNDRFAVVNELKEILVFDEEMYEWELFHTQQGSIQHQFGEARLLSNTSSSNPSSMQHMTVRLCSQNTPFCIASRIKYADLATTNALLFFMWVCITFLVFGYLLFSRIRGHYCSLGKRLERGLSKNSFFPLYQPIICLHTGKVIGCEVLARFKDNQGSIYPDQFIPLIAQRNLSIAFTKVIMQEAMRELRAHGNLDKTLKININLFPRDLKKESLLHFIDIFEDPKNLDVCFELTEDETFDSPEATSNITMLREKGFTIAIDDFGTGYANLNQLQNFEFDYLKIDRSFVMAIEGDTVKSTLIPNIVAMAKQLNVKIVAEGVETDYQSKVLTELGVHLAQGWKYGKPMSAAELATLYKQS